jgi:hypothetical protein
MLGTMAAEDIAAATAAAAAAVAAAAAAAGVDLVTVGTSPRGEPIILILAPLGKKETFLVNNKKGFQFYLQIITSKPCGMEISDPKKVQFRNFRIRKCCLFKKSNKQGNIKLDL